MAEDFTLIFLAEMVVGLVVFCILAAYAYRRIKRFKKDVMHLAERSAAVESAFRTCRNDLQSMHHASDSFVSVTELDHSLNLFSMHVLHHLPRPRQGSFSTHRHRAIKTAVRKR